MPSKRRLPFGRGLRASPSTDLRVPSFGAAGGVLRVPPHSGPSGSGRSAGAACGTPPRRVPCRRPSASPWPRVWPADDACKMLHGYRRSDRLGMGLPSTPWYLLGVNGHGEAAVIADDHHHHHPLGGFVAVQLLADREPLRVADQTTSKPVTVKVVQAQIGFPSHKLPFLRGHPGNLLILRRVGSPYRCSRRAALARVHRRGPRCPIRRMP